jgi:hypothetical protein
VKTDFSMSGQRPSTEPNYSKNCKKLIEDYHHWIIPEDDLKWQDVPEKNSMSIIIDGANGVALMEHYEQLGEIEADWIKIDMQR